MFKTTYRVVAGAFFALASLSAAAGVVTVAAGESKTYSFDNFGYYQSYDTTVYPNMPEQFSFFIKGAVGTTPGTQIAVKLYEDNSADPFLFKYTNTFSAGHPDFGVSQTLGMLQGPLWTDLQGVIKIEVLAGSLSFDFLEASTTFASPVNPNFLVQYRTGDILASTPAPMPISPVVDASDQGGATSPLVGGVTGNTVPEPSTLALLVLGAALLWAYARRPALVGLPGR
jgi:hypothetical protein